MHGVSLLVKGCYVYKKRRELASKVGAFEEIADPIVTLNCPFLSSHVYLLRVLRKKKKLLILTNYL